MDDKELYSEGDQFIDPNDDAVESMVESKVQKPQNFASTFKFADFVQNLLEPLSAKIEGYRVSRVMRMVYFERYVERWRNSVGNDIFPMMRLILPGKDRMRSLYNMKEAKIARLMIDVLKISASSEDAMMLKEWKKPGRSQFAGDFAMIVYEAVKARSLRNTWSDLTIAQVNSLLDELSEHTSDKERLQLLQNIFDAMTPCEFKWIIKIVLNQMHLSVTESQILKSWHPDATHLYNISSSLERICWELTDPKFRLNLDEYDISPFQCFLPQFANFKKRSIDATILSIKAKSFYMEEKFDGERIQLHMEGSKFKYFSRRATDNTYRYGESFSDQNGSLTKYLVNAFRKEVRNIILDGEMIAWAPEVGAAGRFGQLRMAAAEESSRVSEDQIVHHPFFVVFDILYLNDCSLINYPLKERRKALKTVIISVPKRLEIIKYEEANEASEVETFFRQMIEQASEGIILKNPDSVYKLNERNDDWIKLKPDYLDSFGEELDLLILGGFFGSGSRANFISSFICGLRKDSEKDQFISFCRVGGGFSFTDYAEIDSKLREYWRDWSEEAFDYFEFAVNESGKCLMKPDKWILPSESIVLQIKAAEIIPSRMWKSEFTLRFPRFHCFRPDRDHKNSLSVNEFLTMKAEQVDTSSFKVSNKHIKGRSNAKRLKIAGNTINQTEIWEQYKEVKSNVFEGREFIVLTDCSNSNLSVTNLRKLLMNNGANIVLNPSGPETIFIGDENNILTSAAIKSYDCSVIKPEWILFCIKEQQLLPFGLQDCVYANDILRNHLEKLQDENGDSYTAPVSIKNMKTILHYMTLPNVAYRKNLINSFLQEDNWGVFDDLGNWALDGCNIYLFSREQESEAQSRIYALKIYSLGGSIASSINDPNITHIVCINTKDVANISRFHETLEGKILAIQIVSHSWINACWNQKSHVSEASFSISKR